MSYSASDNRYFIRCTEICRRSGYVFIRAMDRLETDEAKENFYREWGKEVTESLSKPLEREDLWLKAWKEWIE